MDELMREALLVPKAVRYMLCDMGYFNEAMKGYMIIGMRKMGFTDSEIRRAVLGMRSAMDENTAREAEKEYLGGNNELS